MMSVILIVSSSFHMTWSEMYSSLLSLHHVSWNSFIDSTERLQLILSNNSWEHFQNSFMSFCNLIRSSMIGLHFMYIEWISSDVSSSQPSINAEGLGPFMIKVSMLFKSQLCIIEFLWYFGNLAIFFIKSIFAWSIFSTKVNAIL